MSEIRAEVILARVESDASALAVLSEVLAPVEAERAQGLRQIADRQRFVTAHGLLRAALGMRLARHPASVPLARKASGQWICEERGLHVSLAHSGERVAVAIADGPVGIDIEAMTGGDVLALARDWLTPEEAAAVAGANPNAMEPLFLRYWTAKEAVLKAAGTGLTVPLADFCVAPPGERPQPITPVKPHAALAGLAVASLPAPDGYVAALSLPHGIWTIAQRDEIAADALSRSMDAYR